MRAPREHITGQVMEIVRGGNAHEYALKVDAGDGHVVVDIPECLSLYVREQSPETRTPERSSQGVEWCPVTRRDYQKALCGRTVQFWATLVAARRKAGLRYAYRPRSEAWLTD